MTARITHFTATKIISPWFLIKSVGLNTAMFSLSAATASSSYGRNLTVQTRRALGKPSSIDPHQHWLKLAAPSLRVPPDIDRQAILRFARGHIRICGPRKACAANLDAPLRRLRRIDDSRPGACNRDGSQEAQAAQRRFSIRNAEECLNERNRRETADGPRGCLYNWRVSVASSKSFATCQRDVQGDRSSLEIPTHLLKLTQCFSTFGRRLLQGTYKYPVAAASGCTPQEFWPATSRTSPMHQVRHSERMWVGCCRQ